MALDRRLPVSEHEALRGTLPPTNGLLRSPATRGYTHGEMTSAWGLDRTPTGVAVRGELDLATAEKFGSAVQGAIESSARGPFSLNLSGVTFIDSSGVHALMRLVKEHGDTEFVIQTSPAVFAVLELGGLTGRALPNTIVVPPPDDEPA